MKVIYSFLGFATMLLLTACGGGGDTPGGGNIKPGTDFIIINGKANLSELILEASDTQTSFTVSVPDNKEWYMTINNSNWPDLDAFTQDGRLNGSNGATVIITTGVNPKANNREASLSFTCGNQSKTLKIIQKAGKGELSYDVKNGTYQIKDGKPSLDFKVDGDKVTISIKANVTWKAEILNESKWVSVAPIEGSNDGDIVVTAEPNTSMEEQSAILRISSAQVDTSYDIVLTQAGKEYELSVKPETMIFDETGGEKSALITCNAEWKATTGENWISIPKPSGSKDDKDVIIKTSPYYDMENPRSGVVIFKSGDKTAQISISQNTATKPTVQGVKAEKESGKNQYIIKFNYSSVFPLSEYGIYFGTAPNPTEKKVIAKEGEAGSDIEVSTVIDVEQAVKYYVKAYIVSPVTTFTSDEYSFRTDGDIPSSDDIPSPGFQSSKK